MFFSKAARILVARYAEKHVPIAAIKEGLRERPGRKQGNPANLIPTWLIQSFMFWRHKLCAKMEGGPETLPKLLTWEVSIFVKPMFEHFHLSRVPGKSSKNHPVFFLDKIILPTPWLLWIWP